MTNLVLYGYQNLNNSKMILTSTPSLRGNASVIQKISNARFSGSTVVDKKVNDKQIAFSGVVKATDTLSLEDVIKEYSLALSKEDRYLRVSPNWYDFTPLADASGFQILGDTTGLTFDTTSFQSGSGSIKFDSDVSVAAGYSGLYTLSGTTSNISDYITDGALEAWVYLPQTAGVTGITIRAGNDVSNYYTAIATTQYDETAFEAGWNFISLSISDCTMTGVVDPYSFGAYVYLTVNYGALMTDRSDFRFGGMLFQQESRTRNYKSYTAELTVSDNHYDISRANCSLSILAYEGVAESTGDYNVLGLSNQTAASTSATVTFDGSHTPLPVISMNIDAATNVSSIELANTTTGDSVDITRTYVAGDKLVIDTKNRSITANGLAVDYNDVLPRFGLGENILQVAVSTTTLETIDELTYNSNLTGEV